ncbi:hypothetical protein OG474_28885 [Kribbella sp. NBC_01505]|uniref:alpha/beta hydrolase family protein n=1 Tax=Kribbella sp. NBC_01505 TaxID=2903580 RepID=UPI00386540E5
MSQILDQFDLIENAVPQLAGRVNREHVAVAGHSLGGFTATQLLGARITDPETGEIADLLEPRIKQGIVFAAPGRGDVLNGPMADAIDFARTIDFSTMTTPALVVIGDKDDSQHFTDLGPDWHADPYLLAPPPKPSSPSSAPNTSSAASRATTPPKPPTRTPNESRPSPASPPPTSTPTSTPPTPPGKKPHGNWPPSPPSTPSRPASRSAHERLPAWIFRWWRTIWRSAGFSRREICRSRTTHPGAR